MTETLNLDFAADDQLAGFRLHRLEVYNWGTFNGKVWTLRLDGKNTLLTGDNGSGKSTLVDAITTLLVPGRGITYNKAAGAHGRERSLKTYVLGVYKKERRDTPGSAKPVALRNSNQYSVILGVFYNEGYDKTVTLAQVFWIKEADAQPARLYVGCERDLSIVADFSGFGNNIANLRKRLRTSGAELFDNFSRYSEWFRHRFGITNEKALDLFYQTVSLKSVDNLTDFVRNHTLEPFDVRKLIDDFITHFYDLNRAHEAIEKAEKQEKALIPIVADCEQRQKFVQATEDLKACHSAIRPWFATLKLDLFSQRLISLNEELERYQSAVNRLEEQRRVQREQERDLRHAIVENGGSRIENIDREIARKQSDLERRKQRASRYEKLVCNLGQSPAIATEEDFLHQRSRITEWQKASEEEETRIQNALTEIKMSINQKKSEYNELKREIKSLKNRISNINKRQIDIRHNLCRALGIAEEEIPFAGELLQIREGERVWEGAIERALHNFGLSLLVPDRYYAQVGRWVDETQLRGRLVYYRVPKEIRRDFPLPCPNSLVHKLQIKPDTPFHAWLEREITYRFNWVCCEDWEQFYRETRAITKTGQIKGDGGKHEKDDRYRIDDRRRYVLGWSNAEKIAVLERDAKQQETYLIDLGKQLETLKEEQSTLSNRRSILSKLGEYADFQDLDWGSVAIAINDLVAKKRELEESLDPLKALASQLTAVETELKKTEAQLDEKKSKYAKTEEKVNSIKKQQQSLNGFLSQVTEDVVQRFDLLKTMWEREFGRRTLTIGTCDGYERDMSDWLQSKIDAQNTEIEQLSERIVRGMARYKEKWTTDTVDVDASLSAASEYKAMLDRLQADDLPRFKDRFRELLRENTIREIANLQSQLVLKQEMIKERLGQINELLYQIDYNPGRYIILEAQASLDKDIRDFRASLRACTENALTGSEDEQYSEEKFFKVKEIVERLKPQGDDSNANQQWANKVTDVRNWFVFAASERRREDDTEYEHYADSSGKSGGQKEKLAYTVLAASLAYQFGLKWGEIRSNSFRFVTIDEAFGRGSDESTQYGLSLFNRLNLQLLIVTPLQKIHVIEPFIASVGYVHNEDGCNSVLRNLSIQEYRAERQKMMLADRAISHDMDNAG